MGVSLDVPEAADIFFEEEMAEMIDDEGKTNAERDRLFANKYKNGIPSAQEPSE